MQTIRINNPQNTLPPSNVARTKNNIVADHINTFVKFINFFLMINLYIIPHIKYKAIGISTV